MTESTSESFTVVKRNKTKRVNYMLSNDVDTYADMLHMAQIEHPEATMDDLLEYRKKQVNAFYETVVRDFKKKHVLFVEGRYHSMFIEPSVPTWHKHNFIKSQAIYKYIAASNVHISMKLSDYHYFPIDGNYKGGTTLILTKSKQ
jgi:hypothetical protein